ncbi:MAG: hypothetical protein JNL28_06775 [Planctomycetes bacterium]|nr:hypothetical protein [Planctomycetota bacterium]
MNAFALIETTAARDLEPDFVTVGLLLALVGSFLLGNAILFRHPRDMVRDRYASSPAAPERARQAPLLGIRAQIFHRLQVSTGFFYLVLGFALQLVGRFRPLQAGVEPSFPVFWITAIALTTALLLAFGWWWSSRAFRRHVRAHLARHPPEFEADTTFAREVGELFGIESHADDTVQTYAARLRSELKLSPPDRRIRRDVQQPLAVDDEDE